MKNSLLALIILVAALTTACVLLLSTSPYTGDETIYEEPLEGSPDTNE